MDVLGLYGLGKDVNILYSDLEEELENDDSEK